MKLSEVGLPTLAMHNIQTNAQRGFEFDEKSIVSASLHLGVLLDMLGAGDVIPQIKIRSLDSVILSILHGKRYIDETLAEYYFSMLRGDTRPLAMSEDIAKAVMDAKDKAGALTGATGDISHSHNFSSFLEYQFPRLGNVKVLSLPGAASLTMLAKIQELGIGKYNTTIVSANGQMGGIWNDPNLVGVRNGSKINPGDFVFDDAIKLDKAQDIVAGSGNTISQFVNKVEGTIQTRRTLHAEVLSIQKIPNTQGYNVVFQDPNGTLFNEEFDIVLFGPGAHIPQSFTNTRFPQVNSDGTMLKYEGGAKDAVQTYSGAGVEIHSHRWQKDPAMMYEMMEKLRANPKAELLIFGFGNSAIEVVQHCIEHSIRFRVVTDIPLECFLFPERVQKTLNGTKRLARSLAKDDFDPQTGIAYDYDEVKKVVKYLLDNQLVVTDARKVIWKQKDGVTTATVLRKDGRLYTYDTIDEHFCLYGYRPETGPIKDIVELSERGITTTDWAHQAISKDTRLSLPGLFVHGLAAYGRNNAVLPGIGYDVHATMVAALLHSIRLHETGNIPEVTYSDVLGTFIDTFKRKVFL